MTIPLMNNKIDIGDPDFTVSFEDTDEGLVVHYTDDSVIIGNDIQELPLKNILTLYTMNLRAKLLDFIEEKYETDDTE